MMNWKGLGRKWYWLNIKILTQNSPGGSEENLSQDIRSPGRDLNPGTSRI
jgi:hypothetical protein